MGFAVNDGQLRKYEQGVNNIKSSAENAANSFRNMFAAFAVFSAVKSIANTADQMQSLEARIGMLPQTVGDAGVAFDEISRKASAARQPVEAYSNLYIRLAGATKEYLTEQKDVLLVTDSISQALVIGGAVASEQASALLQISQAFQKGKLDGDEFKSFMENLSTDFKDKLSAQLGTTTKELYKLSETGKLTAKDLAFAFKAMAPEIEKQMLLMPLTISQGMTIVENKWKGFLHKLNSESNWTTTKIANFFIDSFGKIESGLNKMVDFFGGATQTIKLFGIVLLAAFGPAIMGIIIGGFVALVSVAGLVFGGLILLGVVLEDLYQFFTGGESVIGDFVEWLRGGSIAANILLLALTALAGVLFVVAIGFAAAWVAALSGPMLIIIALMALYAAFLFFKDEVMGFMTTLWTSVTDGFFAMIESLKTAWANFKSFFTSGVNANVTATTVAGSNNPNGPMGGARSFGQNVTIHQTLPPGSTPETAAAAKGATMEAMKATDNGQLSRQMGQAQ